MAEGDKAYNITVLIGEDDWQIFRTSAYSDIIASGKVEGSQIVIDENDFESTELPVLLVKAAMNGELSQ